MKTIFFASVIFLSLPILAFSQSSEQPNNKVIVYIHKQTGKMYSQHEIEGQANQWHSSVPRYIFKQTPDSVFYYLDEDYSYNPNERARQIETQNLEKSIDLGQLVDINGNLIDKDDLNGKVIVINFWGPWCSPCIREIPELNRLTEAYSTKDVIFIAPAVKTNKETIIYFLTQREFTYRIIPDSEELAAKFTMHYPTNVVMDRSGTVKFVKVGYDNSIYDLLSSEIDKYLE